jgi:hypothetical protein
LLPKVELSKEGDIILEWEYKDKRYLCKYISKFELSSDRGFNLLFGPNDTCENLDGIKSQANPFQDALNNGRLRKRNSWKHALSNPAQTITKRKSFRSRQSSIRTESPLQPNPTPVASPILDKKDGDRYAGFAPLAAGPVRQHLHNISMPQIGPLTATGPSTKAAETDLHSRSMQLECAVATLHENMDSEKMRALALGRDIGTDRDSRHLTEEAVQSSSYSPVPMERFLESAEMPYVAGDFMGLRDHYVLASVQENDDGDAQGREQPTHQMKQEEYPNSESPPSKHPQIALQGQNKKAADFPDDYWQWDETRKKHCHRDEDTGSVVSYGPLD